MKHSNRAVSKYNPQNSVISFITVLIATHYSLTCCLLTDYDRLQFCSKDIQKKLRLICRVKDLAILTVYRYFEKQLELSAMTGLPLFLHCRAAFDDVIGEFTTVMMPLVVCTDVTCSVY